AGHTAMSAAFVDKHQTIRIPIRHLFLPSRPKPRDAVIVVLLGRAQSLFLAGPTPGRQGATEGAERYGDLQPFLEFGQRRIGVFPNQEQQTLLLNIVQDGFDAAVPRPSRDRAGRATPLQESANPGGTHLKKARNLGVRMAASVTQLDDAYTQVL